jgi:hypothetical protein
MQKHEWVFSVKEAERKVPVVYHLIAVERIIIL